MSLSQDEKDLVVRCRMQRAMARYTDGALKMTAKELDDVRAEMQQLLSVCFRDGLLEADPIVVLLVNRANKGIFITTAKELDFVRTQLPQQWDVVPLYMAN